MKKKSFIFLFVFLIAKIIFSQNHYWTNQYGATNTLLGGANTASVRDNAAIYYNPGCMGFIDNPKISISANVYKADFLNLKNVGGDNINAKTTKVLFFPEILGGNFTVKKVPALKIFYGILTRNRESVRFSAKNEMLYDLIPNSPNQEYYKGRLDYNFNSFENWAGLGVGYKLNDKFSVGASFFGTYLNVENSVEVSTNTDATYSDSSGHSFPYTASVNGYTSTRIDHIGLIVKMGAAMNLKKLKLGITISLPSATIWGRGSIAKSYTGNNLNYNSNSSIPLYRYSTFLLEDAQENLKATYKTVPSFSIGASYLHKNLGLFLTTEFFLGNQNYNIFKGKDQAYFRPSYAYGGEIIKDFSSLSSRSKPIVNVALGVSYKFKNKFKLLTSFRTDFNNQINFLSVINFETNRVLQVPEWHLLHYTIGCSYYKGANDISVGFNYAFGFATSKRQMINFTQPNHDYFLRGEIKNNMKTIVNSLSLIVGYTYYFKSNPKGAETVKDKMEDW